MAGGLALRRGGGAVKRKAPDRTSEARVVIARAWLAKGHGLKEAARASGIPADKLDKGLWKCLGLNDRDVMDGKWRNRRREASR